ncbi:hypothetical protein E3N88_00093 [Mikania micrantha]|uniref:Zinc finger, CCHC-type n=1 Tax=Mikania micrantha TaxID=192012 RepID=A0A5N6PYI7_9ASTR|nr:hypothetical protein E3N88_00093 [Mikania micrantha]
MIEPSANTQTDEKKDMTATAYLFQALPEDMIIQITNCKSAKEIWDALKTRNVSVENVSVDRVQKARLQTLKTEFEMLKMKEEDTIDSFTAKLNGIVTKASNLGTIYDQSTLVRKLLSSVPKRSVQIAATIEQFADLEATTLDEIIGRLKAFEERTSLLNEDSENNQGKQKKQKSRTTYNDGNFKAREEVFDQIMPKLLSSWTILTFLAIADLIKKYPTNLLIGYCKKIDSGQLANQTHLQCDPYQLANQENEVHSNADQVVNKLEKLREVLEFKSNGNKIQRIGPDYRSTPPGNPLGHFTDFPIQMTPREYNEIPQTPLNQPKLR